MIQYTFLIHPSAIQLNQMLDLYRMAGWWSGRDGGIEVIAGIIAGSHCVVTAAQKDTIIGMGRAISDRISDAYIQDVTVHEAYRGQGIGTQIIENLVRRLVNDGVGWIGLIAERNSHGFYARIGFEKMPDSIPMIRILK